MPSLESLEIVIIVKVNHDSAAWRGGRIARGLRRRRDGGPGMGGQRRWWRGVSVPAASAMTDAMLAVEAMAMASPPARCWERPDRVCLRSHRRPVLRAHLIPGSSRPAIAGRIDAEEIDLVLQGFGLRGQPGCRC